VKKMLDTAFQMVYTPCMNYKKDTPNENHSQQITKNTPNENHSQQNNLNYFTFPIKINSLGGQKVLDKGCWMSYNSIIL